LRLNRQITSTDQNYIFAAFANLHIPEQQLSTAMTRHFKQYQNYSLPFFHENQGLTIIVPITLKNGQLILGFCFGNTVLALKLAGTVVLLLRKL